MSVRHKTTLLLVSSLLIISLDQLLAITLRPGLPQKGDSKKCNFVVSPQAGHSYYYNLAIIQHALDQAVSYKYTITDLRYACQCKEGGGLESIFEVRPDDPECEARKMVIICPPRIKEWEELRRSGGLWGGPMDEEEWRRRSHHMFDGDAIELARELFAVRDEVSEYFDELIGPADDESWCERYRASEEKVIYQP